MSWILVTLKPNQPKRVEEDLGNQGFPSFFSKIACSWLEESIIKDIIHGHGFIEFTKPEKFICINPAKGVARVMRSNDLILQLSNSEIANQEFMI